MNILKAIKKLSFSLSLESDPDIILTGRAILRGMLNFYQNKVDTTSKNNAYICKECPDRIDETDSDMKVTDKEFDFLSGKMCGACGGCVLSFKVRQDIKPCEKWQQKN